MKKNIIRCFLAWFVPIPLAIVLWLITWVLSIDVAELLSNTFFADIAVYSNIINFASQINFLLTLYFLSIFYLPAYMIFLWFNLTDSQVEKMNLWKGSVLDKLNVILSVIVAGGGALLIGGGTLFISVNGGERTEFYYTFWPILYFFHFILCYASVFVFTVYIKSIFLLTLKHKT